MSLTGLPLIVLAILGTALVIAATVLTWNRWGRTRFVLRATGVLLAEALVLLSVGLVVNRQQEFYPSWAALSAPSTTNPATYHTTAGGLDGKLAQQAGGQDGARLFAWKPAGWAGWRLSGAPAVSVPAGYLSHPSWRYSVVLVAGSWPSWQNADESAVAARASQDVVVFVSPTAATAVKSLASELPAGLGRDLRVTAHRWAIVTARPDDELLRAVVLAAPGQFPAIASVDMPPESPLTKTPRTPPGKTPPGKTPPGKTPPGKITPSGAPASKAPAAKAPAAKGKVAAAKGKVAPAKGKVESARVTLATRTGKSVLILQKGKAGRKPAAVIILPAGVSAFEEHAGTGSAGILTAVSAAVGWAAGQTPPPLAASAPPVKALPVYHHPHSPGPSGSVPPSTGPSGAPPAPGKGRANGPRRSRL